MGPTVRPPRGAPLDRRPGVERRRVGRVVIGLLASAGALLALDSLAGSAAAARTAAPSSRDEAAVARDHLGCPTCHAEPGIVAEREGEAGRRLFVEPDVLEGTPHRELTCDSCHPNVSALLHADLAAEREFALRSCAGCHGDADRAVLDGAHAPSASDPGDAPTCATCHAAHEVADTEDADFLVGAAATCSDCHDERGRDFFTRDYHGKQSALGRRGTALCADCHGAHLVLGAAEVASPIHTDNVADTCRSCHASAPDNFGQVIVHVEGEPLPSDPRLRMVTIAMLLILVGTFFFFGAHTALAIRHAWHSRTRPRPGRPS